VKVIKVQKKQKKHLGEEQVYWATVEYTKEELEKEFPSIEYQKSDPSAADVWEKYIKGTPLSYATISST
jgi:hypothetical protein